MTTYREVYEAWESDPEGFWMQAAQAIDWVKKPSRALFDENAPFYEWFSDGLVNSCHNAVDRHVAAGRGDHIRQPRDRQEGEDHLPRIAGARGPPRSRLGAIHSVVFGGFAANELAVRIDDAEPKSMAPSRWRGTSRISA